MGLRVLGRAQGPGECVRHSHPWFPPVMGQDIRSFPCMGKVEEFHVCFHLMSTAQTCGPSPLLGTTLQGPPDSFRNSLLNNQATSHLGAFGQSCLSENLEKKCSIEISVRDGDEENTILEQENQENHPRKVFQ